MKNWIVFGLTAASFSLLAGSAAFADNQCQVGEIAKAKNDVDVYNSPVEPREKYKDYFIKLGKAGKVLARHEDGWCKLAGVAPDGGEGWVAEDHLEAASGGAESEPETGSDSSMESEPEDDSTMESEPAPAPETETKGEPDAGAPADEPAMGGGGAGGGGGEADGPK